MTFTLAGRIQTRVFLILLVGVPWTCLITPLLAVFSHGGGLATYRVTFVALAIMTVLGVIWDSVYYALQQLRWDKDWPSSFALLTGLNEAATTWLALHVFIVPPAVPFAIHFSTTWVLMFLAAQGPLRVLFPHWRFQGGRLVTSSVHAPPWRV